jgi:NUMOD3 motif
MTHRKPHSPETRAKISAALTGHKMSDEAKQKLREFRLSMPPAHRKPHSPETKKKMSDTAKAMGRTMSEEQKERLRQLRLGARHTQETKDKIRQSKKDHPLSAEVRAHMSACKLGVKRKPFTDEHKANLKAALAKARLRKKEIEEADISGLSDTEISDLISASVGE